MEKQKKSLSIKNKILIVLSTLPILSIALIVVMATNLFKDDKLAYVYDTALSSTLAKASTVDSQLNSYIQSLKAMNSNFDPVAKALSNNGKTYFSAERDLKAFLHYGWDGKQFYEKYQISKDLSFSSAEMAIMTTLMEETWYSNFTVGVSQQHPMHLYLMVKNEIEGGSEITIMMIENANFFSMFGEGPSGDAFLYHKMRGRVLGGEKFKGLDGFLTENVFVKKINEGIKESKFKDMEYLTSYSNVGKANLYVVSMVNKYEALAAVRTLMRRSVYFSAGILCVLIIVGVFAANGLTAALRSLADATSKVMDGDFSVRVEPKSGDEIGSLALNFNKMTEEVSRLMDKTAENARMEAELQTANTVQETLFPRNDAKIGPFNIFGDSVPASECGGDWWHYSHIDGKVWLWIGDATGHGVPAALLTSAARAVASVIEGIDDITPARALSMMNQAIYATSKGEMMMTFFLACFDMKTNTMTYSNASHDPPFMLSHEVEGKPKRRDYQPLMDVNNPRLGESPKSEYKDHTMDIHRGDKIVFYTDGIVDVKAPSGDLFGERRFLKSLGIINDEKVEGTVKSVFAELNEFRSETPLDDDVTLVVLEYEREQATQRNAA